MKSYAFAYLKSKVVTPSYSIKLKVDKKVKMKQEEEEINAKFCSDEWLRQSTEMEGKEIKTEAESFSESFRAEDAICFDKEYKDIKKEDALIFGSDAWLRHCAEKEIKEETDIKPIIPDITNIKIEHKKLVKTEVTNSESFRNSTKIETISLSNNYSSKPTESPNTSNANESTSQSSTMENAVVSEIASTGLCTFSCPSCSAKYKSWDGFRKHMTSEHKKSVSITSFESFLTEAIVHICKICSEKHYCDTNFLGMHLAKKHNLAVHRYSKLYNCFDTWKENSKTCLGSSNLRIIKNAAVSEIASTGLCTLSCPFCCSKYTCWQKFRQHMKMKHQKGVSLTNFSSFLTEATIHICKICSEKLFCETWFLGHHLAKKHGLGLNNYRKRYNCGTNWKEEYEQYIKKGRLSSNVVGNLCTFKCPTCNKTYKGVESFRYHTQKQSKKKCLFKYSAEKMLACLEDVVTHRCKLCLKLMLCSKDIISRHMSDNHSIKSLKVYAKKTGCQIENARDRSNKCDIISKCTNIETHKVGDLCKYTCDKCEHVAKNWVHMRNHVKLAHGVHVTITCWSKYITETVLHTCMICEKKMLNERRYLHSHFDKKHNTTLLKYAKQYKLTEVKHTDKKK